MNAAVTVSHEIALITLKNISATMSNIADIFEKIAQKNIDVDMISLAPVQGASTGLSFTIKDDQLINLLELTKGIKSITAKPVVSSGNHIVSIFDKEMENNPGIAAKVFRAVERTGAEVCVVSTSEVQISLLFTDADFDKAYEAIQKLIAE